MSLYRFNVRFPNALNPRRNFFLNKGFCTSGCSASNSASKSASTRGVTARLSIFCMSEVGVRRRLISKSLSLPVLQVLLMLEVLLMLGVRDISVSSCGGVVMAVPPGVLTSVIRM